MTESLHASLHMGSFIIIEHHEPLSRFINIKHVNVFMQTQKVKTSAFVTQPNLFVGGLDLAREPLYAYSFPIILGVNVSQVQKKTNFA